METILQKYEFRTIRLEETEQAAEIERICFPPNEACSYEHMAARIKKAPDLFLVAVDRETGKLAGFLNGLATAREHLTDDFFTDASVHNPEGKNIMLHRTVLYWRFKEVVFADVVSVRRVCFIARRVNEIWRD